MVVFKMKNKKTGMLSSRGNLALMVDADGASKFEDLTLLVFYDLE